tara:strand:+ start:412 stop:666 length:255 start_codon:yes stop_codon:yes gene_type:complete
MKQQTAVEWLVNELKISKHYQRVINEVNQSSTDIKDVIQEAKAMEKEQIRLIYEGLLQNVGTSIKQSDLPTFEQYYNETFNKTL